MLTAFFRDGRDINDPNTFAELAVEQGLDGNTVAEYAASTQAHTAARNDFAAAAALGVHAYPTLLITVCGLTQHLANATTPPKMMLDFFEAAVAAGKGLA